MDIEHLMAEIKQLSPGELQQFKEGIARRERELGLVELPDIPEKWRKELDSFLDQFWENSSEEEEAAILDAIRYKNIPLKKSV